MEDEDIKPPPGYQPALHFRYPKIALQIAAVILVVALTPILLIFTAMLQGNKGTLSFILNLNDLLLVVVTIIVTVIIHEAVHGLVYQLLGYKVTYGASLQLLAAYAGAFKQWQKRDHNIAVAAAPLLLLSLLLLPLLALDSRMLVLVGFTALLFNIGGAVGDIYLIWRLARLPRETLVYDLDPTSMLLFLPAND